MLICSQTTNCVSNHLTMSVHEEGYPRNVLCTLNWIDIYNFIKKKLYLWLYWISFFDFKFQLYTNHINGKVHIKLDYRVPFEQKTLSRVKTLLTLEFWPQTSSSRCKSKALIGLTVSQVQPWHITGLKNNISDQTLIKLWRFTWTHPMASARMMLEKKN